MEWHDGFGAVGVVLVLGTYLLLQLERLDARHMTYALLNALGSLFILVSLVYNFNLSAFAIEAAWLVISVFGMVMAYRRSAGSAEINP